MLELILKQFVKDHKNTGNPAVRTRYVMVGSVAGIIVHMLMFAVKLTAGLLSNSLTIIADSFMGLSDSLSSVFSIIGARIADKPANAKRPFGYGRVEYMTAVVIAALILFFGLSLLQSAVKRMFTPEDMEFSILVLSIMLLSICARALLGLFHHSLGKRVNSTILQAAAQDAKGDCIITSLSVISILVFKYTGLNPDAYLSAAVSIYIIYMGFKLVMETVSPLIGEAAQQQIYDGIMEIIGHYPEIIETHDFILHEYGPVLRMASIDIVLPVTLSFEYAHEIADRIEQEVFRKHGIRLVTHMDPVDDESSDLKSLRETVAEVVQKHEPNAVIHHLRIIRRTDQIFCIFDLEIPFGYQWEEEISLKLDIMVDVESIDEQILCAIRTTRNYVAGTDR